MDFCGKCGEQIDGKKFCPKCGTPTGIEEKKNESISKKSSCTVVKVILGMAILAIVGVGIINLTSISKEPCDWCGKSPSVAYEKNDGSDAYVCKECSEHCAWCGEKAKKHYENLLGLVVFVCNDCYEGLSGN